jgi:hypothetical protein
MNWGPSIEFRNNLEPGRVIKGPDELGGIVEDRACFAPWERRLAFGHNKAEKLMIGRVSRGHKKKKVIPLQVITALAMQCTHQGHLPKQINHILAIWPNYG